MTTTRTSKDNSRLGIDARPRQPQLLLISDSPTAGTASSASWTLDEETRETGRRGLAKARAALRATRPPHLDIAA